MNILKINGTALTGIYVDAAVSFNKPAKRVETFSVPGRNGDLVIDEGTFDNVLISYPVYEKSTFPDEFDAIVNWLASLQGYQRIECSNDPNHFRLGRFVVPQTPTAKRLNKDGYYTLTFDCKPQRWLLSGEEETEIDNASVIIASDSDPYLFRKSGGAQDITGADRETDKLIGGTVAWNQLAPTLTATDWALNNITGTFSNNKVTLTVGTVGSWLGVNRKTAYTLNGHKYLVGASITSPKAIRFTSDSSATIKSPYTVANKKTNVALIKSAPNNSAVAIYLRGTEAGLEENDEIVVEDVVIFDLTQMFGSTIADYLYTLESGTAGAGVAFFKKLFPKPYYAYNTGTLLSVNASSHNTIGFNQWDEVWESGDINSSGNNSSTAGYYRSKNYIPVLPSTTYYLKFPVSMGVFSYDANKGFIGVNYLANDTFTTGSNTHFIRFRNATPNEWTPYNNDICINLFWDGSRNGEYEPYVKHSYALDSDLTLRGIPKLDANNNLYYDGDEYTNDGTVARKYGIVDLGSLSWTYDSSVPRFYSTDKQNEVAKPSASVVGNIVCDKYTSTWANNIWASGSDKIVAISSGGAINVKDTAYTTAASFKTAMSGVYLVYELATPTEETAEWFTSPQVVDVDGTEEYTDYGVAQGTRDVAIPVGHETDYFNRIGYAIDNPTHFTSKPLIRVYGDGVFYVNDTSVTIAAHTEPYIDIDCELQECYYEGTNMSAYVTFSNNDYPELVADINGIMPTPTITKLVLTPRWWIL